MGCLKCAQFRPAGQVLSSAIQCCPEVGGEPGQEPADKKLQGSCGQGRGHACAQSWPAAVAHAPGRQHTVCQHPTRWRRQKAVCVLLSRCCSVHPRCVAVKGGRQKLRRSATMQASGHGLCPCAAYCCVMCAVSMIGAAATQLLPEVGAAPHALHDSRSRAAAAGQPWQHRKPGRPAR